MTTVVFSSVSFVTLDGVDSLVVTGVFTCLSRVCQDVGFLSTGVRLWVVVMFIRVLVVDGRCIGGYHTTVTVTTYTKVPLTFGSWVTVGPC